jgi:hypothetical protein
MRHWHDKFGEAGRRWLIGLTVLIAAFALVAPEARAQDPFTEFFGGLFGGGGRAARPKPHPAAPSAPTRVRRIMPHQENRAPTYWRRGESRRDKTLPPRADRASAPTPRGPSDADKSSSDGQVPTPDTTATPQPQASYFVAVMGDALGVLLSNGLEEVLGDTPDIQIVKDAKSSSGLVRDDFFDWSKAARDIAGGSQKIDVAVIMIGSNDRQQIRQGAETLDPMTPRWREIYAARVDSVLQPFRERKIPVVWVGLPVMKSESFSVDMAKLNEICKERALRQGDIYVDLWETFSDERGQYDAFGPDIDGEIVKIRSADGVHFTPAGAVSVGHFVAAEIRKLYNARRPGPGVATLPAAPAAAASPDNPSARTLPSGPIEFRSPVPPAFSTAPSLADRPAIGPVQSLELPRNVAGGELARKSGDPLPDGGDAAARALAHHVFVQGGDQSARKNRADDFTWKASASGPGN